MFTNSLPIPSDSGAAMRTWCVEVVQDPVMAGHLPNLPGALAAACTPLTATAAMRIPHDWPQERIVREVLRVLPPYFEPGNINAWDQPWEWDQCAPTVETIARASLRACQCGRWPHRSCECARQGPSYPRPCSCDLRCTLTCGCPCRCGSEARINGARRPCARHTPGTRCESWTGGRRCSTHDETSVYLAKDVRWEGPFS